MSWRVSILKDPGMSQTQYAVCIKRQSQSQLIVRSAVITSVMSVLLCREMSGELFLSGARHDIDRALHDGRHPAEELAVFHAEQSAPQQGPVGGKTLARLHLVAA